MRKFVITEDEDKFGIFHGAGMNSVRAFWPRKSDSPQYVADGLDGLEERLGEFIGGEQCDRCGNHTYRIEHSNNYVARCAHDPDEDPEFRGFEPCGFPYPINIYDENEVTF